MGICTNDCTECKNNQINLCDNCKICERRSKTSSRCLVFVKRPKKCWAFTLDPDWAKKVKKETDLYKKSYR